MKRAYNQTHKIKVFEQLFGEKIRNRNKLVLDDVPDKLSEINNLRSNFHL